MRRPAKTFRVVRDLTPTERRDADDAVKPGDTVYEFKGATWGCIRYGVAVSYKPGDAGPFFEMPEDALEEIPAGSAISADAAFVRLVERMQRRTIEQLVSQHARVRKVMVHGSADVIAPSKVICAAIEHVLAQRGAITSAALREDPDPLISNPHAETGA